MKEQTTLSQKSDASQTIFFQTEVNKDLQIIFHIQIGA